MIFEKYTHIYFFIVKIFLIFHILLLFYSCKKTEEEDSNFCRQLFLDISTIDFSLPHRNQQGFAIHEDYGFIFYDTGLCNVVNMRNKSLVSQFHIATSAPNNHANNANFGIEYPADNNFPAIYISKFNEDGDCFVESITLNGSKLIQTIRLALENNQVRGITWAVDTENKHIWAIGYKHLSWHKKEDNVIYYIKFKLPRLAEGDILLTDEDIIERFEMPYHIHQGFYIKNNKIYAPWGMGSQCGLLVLDIAKREYIISIDLGYWGAEPEGIDEYNGNLIISHNHGFKGQLIELCIKQ